MKNNNIKIEGRLIDIFTNEIYNARIRLKGKRIKKIKRIKGQKNQYIIPGLIDSHVHIESSMLTPGAFSKACVPHGTIGAVADPHEIANVLGMKGVSYMIKDAQKVPVKFWFGAPSCVPATDCESNGGSLDEKEIRKLLKKKNITHLGEMMNYPGVISENKSVLKKIQLAASAGKPVDGHAPALKGKDLSKYINAGISTDHECSTIEEAGEKLKLGMNIIIREGSAARNLDALKELYHDNPDKLMLCSDDIHPEMLEKRHINKVIAKLISEGYNVFDVLRSASMNPVNHYRLNAGLLRQGDLADFVIVENLDEMNVLETWINGKKVYDRGKVLFKYKAGKIVNKFNCSGISEKDIRIVNEKKNYRIIKSFDGELITKQITEKNTKDKYLQAEPGKDILKIIVKDRYKDKKPSVGFISGFGIKDGAFAGSIAHDSHNIIATGTNDSDIVKAVNEIIRLKGGLAVAINGQVSSLELNIAGIMSDKKCSIVASKYEELSALVKMRGCKMTAPFMTLSFMALLVIPELKISDRGLFDVNSFQHVPLFIP